MATSEQLQNARIIVAVGNEAGANANQLLAAIEAALVESGLRNLNYGDRDSLGLFQQRPSQGWGSQSDVVDPYYAARAFFLGAGTNRGALQVSQGGTAGELAQRVQRSAFPLKYDQREADALGILAQLGASSFDNFFGIPVDYGSPGVNPAIPPAATWYLDQSQKPAGIGVGGIALAAVGVVLLVWIIS